MWLRQEEIHELYGAAINARLDRKTLLSGLNVGFRSSLPVASSPGEQLLSDLNELNETERLADDSVPLLSWLRTARQLATPRIEARTFERFLHQVEAAVSTRAK